MNGTKKDNYDFLGADAIYRYIVAIYRHVSCMGPWPVFRVDIDGSVTSFDHIRLGRAGGGRVWGRR